MMTSLATSYLPLPFDAASEIKCAFCVVANTDEGCFASAMLQL